MINLDNSDKVFLLEIAERFGISSIDVKENSRIFSQEIEDKIQESDNEMEGYYNHLTLMELSAELSHMAKTNGPFKILLSDGNVRIEGI